MGIEVKVRDLLFSAIDQINQDRSENEQIEKHDDTPLFNEDGGLDSLGVIDLIVILEKKIQNEFKITLALANENTMNQEESPFKTIKTFIDYVVMMINKEC